jgi:glycosyltransferase involved in cell wall biosynthesis
MGAVARQKVEKEYDWTVIAGKYYSIYRQLIV